MEFMVKMIVYDETLTLIRFVMKTRCVLNLFDPGIIRGPSRHRIYFLLIEKLFFVYKALDLFLTS